MTKEHSPTPVTSRPQPQAQAQPDSGLSIVSMILGITSLTGPGLLLGIPAIITGSIALKKNLGGRGLSITGLVTGIISTVLSILFLTFIAFLIVWGVNRPGDFEQQLLPEETEQPYGSSQT